MTGTLKFVPLELAAGAGSPALVLGIIADTHGLLRPEAVAALSGCHGIVHAGDLGRLEVYDALTRLAPTVAIRGNVDQGPWAKRFPETLAVSVGGANIYVLHDLHALSFDPAAVGVNLVISGHSHHPVIKEKAGVLYVNPGSAGPRRFSLPVTFARLKIGPGVLETELIDVLANAPTTTMPPGTARRAGSA